ncbi:TlpA family protein disulfide reductase [Polaribacter batillariae]|uniref:TlpA family protein disulfide reductase n=1 Tax=Polaribacter batillariae TaxID=2808900 RepID=A0ABX7SX33_9FLAO|nr:TlpA disulfide reductase family protein [Polaribacter batillariae]QTD37408.1 TlpA family protein disulfide reductase [Polaribacter batillariae]
MKNFGILLLTLLILSSCTKEKDFVSLSGKLDNNKDSLITIAGQKGPIKTIKINDDGTFKDTLQVKKADIFTFQTSTYKRSPIYLKNGYDLDLKGNAAKFMRSFKFSGKGADNSNFLISQISESQKIGNPALVLKLSEEAFEEKVNSIKNRFDSILNSYKDLDTALISKANKQTDLMVSYFKTEYAKMSSIRKGKTSPKFENYMDFKGGKKSLDSYKGKYVYIDVWATWCGPCLQQIPYLKELTKEYKGKNIEFISISTDEPTRSGGSWETAEKKWRKMVKERDLKGVQLWAGEDNSFQQSYRITGIPRFILVDPNGNIVDANAPRPSQPNLKELFTSLGI